MNIRAFKPNDAGVCFKIRSEAFILKFYHELGPEAVAAGVNAYLPDDYARMAKKMQLYVVEDNGQPKGFFTFKRKDTATAEITLLYIDLNHVRKGIGKACIHFIEEWLSSNWPEVVELIVDTVIPDYNSGFYKSVGFIPTGETFCDFPNMRVKTLRLCKELKT